MPRRTYDRQVPRDQRMSQGANTLNSLGFQRIQSAGGDRVEVGNTWWRPVRLGQRPVTS